jgi:hypothetical protein
LAGGQGRALADVESLKIGRPSSGGGMDLLGRGLRRREEERLPVQFRRRLLELKGVARSGVFKGVEVGIEGAGSGIGRAETLPDKSEMICSRSAINMSSSLKASYLPR